jgi:hypothetical protein
MIPGADQSHMMIKNMRTHVGRDFCSAEDGKTTSNHARSKTEGAMQLSEAQSKMKDQLLSFEDMQMA